jgi:hypothetical protein
MSDTPNWRQVRLFSSLHDDQDKWFREILNSVLKPFFKEFPNAPFWFSEYIDFRGRDQEDVSDTEIEKIIPPYLAPGGYHFSARIRFVDSGKEEEFLKEKCSDKKYLHTGFRDYPILSCIERFCESTEEPDKIRRANILLDLWYANCRLILDILDGDKFETNSHSLNGFDPSTFFSTTHILTQMLRTPDGRRLPLFWQNPKNPKHFVNILDFTHLTTE